MNTQLNNDTSFWRKAVKELSVMRDEFTKYSGIMTNYERVAITNEITRRQNELYPMAVAGIRAELNGAIQSYQSKAAALEKAKVAEIQRWDAKKLADQIIGLQTLVNFASAADPLRGGADAAAARIQKVYQEALQSGDLHTQRAACEVVVGLRNVNLLPEIQKGLVKTIVDAETRLHEMRITDDMVSAAEALRAEAQNLLALRSEVLAAAPVLGETPDPIFLTGDIQKAVSQIGIGEDGYPLIRDPNDPETAEVVFKGMP